MGKYVGIDLGTTFSAIAYIDDNGNPKIIENSQGENITPSAVLFGGKQPVVGTIAKRKSITDPQNYEAFVKRHMADPSYSFTAKNGESYRPEEISAEILIKLKNDAETNLGEPIDGAVITVPAYFKDPERVATRHAAEIAGLKVLDILEEPTAAAIAFGVSRNIETTQKVMIYDFGGGTFDVSVLEIDGGNIKSLSVNGANRLGGYNIDMAIVDYVKGLAKEKGIDIDGDVKAKQELMLQAENAKKELSSSDNTSISIYVKGEDFTVELDRELFEELIDSILENTISIMQGAVTEARLDYKDINKILLVGGSTRIPIVRRLIEEETGIKPSSEVHPDEAVAIGAAYHAVDCAKKAAANRTSGSPEAAVDIPPVSKNYEFQNVISCSIGVIVIDVETGDFTNSIILKKNTPVPAEVVADGYSTSDKYQDVLSIEITQGESSDPNYVVIVGSADLKLKPRDHLVPISFIVSCDKNGIIHVRAVDSEENVDLGEVKINREKYNMTEEEVAGARTRIAKLNIG